MINGSGIGSLLRGGDGNDTLSIPVNYMGGNTNTLEGGAGEDLIKIGTLTTGDDRMSNTIVGGAGNDRIESGGWTDTYMFNRGDGQDAINDGGTNPYSQPIGADKIVFGAGIATSDISATRSDNHLVIQINDPNNQAATDRIMIENWNNASHSIEEFVFADSYCVEQ